MSANKVVEGRSSDRTVRSAIPLTLRGQQTRHIESTEHGEPNLSRIRRFNSTTRQRPSPGGVHHVVQRKAATHEQRPAELNTSPVVLSVRRWPVRVSGSQGDHIGRLSRFDGPVRCCFLGTNKLAVDGVDQLACRVSKPAGKGRRIVVRSQPITREAVPPAVVDSFDLERLL
jgi:hypothetical protein